MVVNPVDILVLSWEVVWVGVSLSSAPEVAAVAVIGQTRGRPVAHCLPLWETSGGPFPLLAHCSTNLEPTSRGERHTLAAQTSKAPPSLQEASRQRREGKSKENGIEGQI